MPATIGQLRLDLKITMDGDVQLQRRLARMMADVGDLRPWFQSDVLPILRQSIQHQFDSQGDPSWAPLSARYAALKARRHPGAGVLVATGALRDSLLRQGARGNISRLSATRLEWGTALGVRGGWNLGLLHHRGAPRANLPSRGILRLLDRFKSAIMHSLARRLNREVIP